jgi:hypothetical protein
MTRRGGAWLDLAVLSGIGAAVVGVAAWSGTWELSRAHPASYSAAVAAGLALWGLAGAWVVVRRPRGRAVLIVVLLVALGARLVLVPNPPDLSGDINRYVWDGRVQAAGINPYRYAPDDPRLAALRDPVVHPKINHIDDPTIYPPVAQGVFAGLHQVGLDTVTRVKLAFSVLDVVTVLLIAILLARIGRPPAWALLYGWHPLGVMEVGRSGHVDAVAVLLLMAALVAVAGRRRDGIGGVLLAAGALVKPSVAAVLPAVAGRGRRMWRLPAAFGATAVAAYLPYLGVGSGVFGYLPGYLDEEGFADGRRYYLLAQAERFTGPLDAGPVTADRWYPLLAALIVGCVAVWCLRDPRDDARAMLDRSGLLLVVVFLLASPSYPWYLLAPLALIPLLSGWIAVPAIAITCAAPFVYLRWWLDPAPEWPLHLGWGLGAALLATMLLARWIPYGRRPASLLGFRPAAGPTLPAPASEPSSDRRPA